MSNQLGSDSGITMARTVDKHEREWVEAARGGDSEAVAWLYDQYCDRVYSYVYVRLEDHSATEDVTAQVFLKVVEKIEAYSWQGAGFAAWLFKIAHNQVIDAQRKQSRQRHFSIDGPGVHLLPAEGGDRSDPQKYVERSEILALLRACISELSDLQAQVILLKYAAELSNPEIAEVMSRTTNAVNSLHYEATKKLGSLLTERGYRFGY